MHPIRFLCFSNSFFCVFPNNIISPLSGKDNPETNRINVVFPAPFGIHEGAHQRTDWIKAGTKSSYPEKRLCRQAVDWHLWREISEQSGTAKVGGGGEFKDCCTGIQWDRFHRRTGAKNLCRFRHRKKKQSRPSASWKTASKTLRKSLNMRNNTKPTNPTIFSIRNRKTLTHISTGMRARLSYGKAKAAFPHPANSVAHSSIRRGVIHTAHNAEGGGIPHIPSYLLFTPLYNFLKEMPHETL